MIQSGTPIAAMWGEPVIRHTWPPCSRSPRWPFHKEGIVGAFGWHLIMCVLTIVLPTYQCIEALLAERCAGATAGLVPLCW